MPDVSKIKTPDGTSYDIKDTTSRSGLADKMDKVNPTGSGNFSFNATSISGTSNVNLCSGGIVGGTCIFACGYDNTVGGTANIVGGYDNSISGTANIVGGYNNIASEVTVADSQGQEQTYFPNYDAVFGRNNTVDGGSYNIVAGRGNTIGVPSYCSLFGYGLKTSANYQHICGRWNETLTGVVEIVGWGSSDSNRANIRTLSTAGNEVLAGTIEATGLGATLKQAVIDAIYPVGSIYMTVTDNTAAKVKARFGGTWVAWGSGRVPVGVDSDDTNFSTVEKTGGRSTVTLTAAQSGVPQHTHNLSSLTLMKSTIGSTKYGFATGETFAGDIIVGQNTGKSTTTAFSSGIAGNNTTQNASQAHTNLQPYITCYMWKRTA